MTDENNNLSMENHESQKESAGCLGLGFSLIFPIVGIILYFVKKSEKFDASGYLYAAGAGFVIGILLRIMTGAIY